MLSCAGAYAVGHNELEEVPNIYQLLNQHPPELWKIFVAINISYNVAETNNSKDKYKYVCGGMYSNFSLLGPKLWE